VAAALLARKVARGRLPTPFTARDVYRNAWTRLTEPRAWKFLAAEDEKLLVPVAPTDLPEPNGLSAHVGLYASRSFLTTPTPGTICSAVYTSTRRRPRSVTLR